MNKNDLTTLRNTEYEIRTADNGFTLIEMIMIIVIVAVLGMIVVPKMAGILTSNSLEAEAKKMKAKIRQAQDIGITKSTTSRMVFDTDTETYNIQYDSGGGSYTLVETIDLDNNIEIDSTTFTNPANNTLDFNSFGAPSEGGNIILRDAGADTITVSITEATGRVVIQ